MSTDTFDFDEWATLAKSAPCEFEQRRLEYIEQLMSKYGDTHRLRGLQCSIDMERMRARTALKSCLRISSLMWDSLLVCQDELNGFVRISSVSEIPTSFPAQQVQVVNFRQKNKEVSNNLDAANK